MGRVKLGGLLAVAAPILAIVFAMLITSVVLIAAGKPALDTFGWLIDNGSQPRSIVNIVNLGTTYYLAAVAVAIGFRMNLFNIGVDGQYRLAALISAAVGGAAVLPGVLNIVLVVVVAVAVGGLWAAIAGFLKVRRGVSEVISTIMLNAIATAFGSWLLIEHFGTVNGNAIATTPIPDNAHVPAAAIVPGTQLGINTFVIVAIVVGIAYAVVLSRTRFGFNLRATGRSEPAAVASGVSVKKMVLITMILSGGAAGLIGMPELLGSSFTYNTNFPAGLGFTGIAVALLGRNNAVGMAIGALLFSFLDTSSDILQLHDISPEIVKIMQGAIVLSVIIAYELAHRYRLVAEQRRVSRELLEGAAA
ncbi:ABC transporter permease [Streptosporangiaceae bacterium NEAU-GS5]|nr:ABC transporter permease [Streptosporangiaceae bacterium NEAU-GS5]